jgi:hypothetical protein
MTPSPRRAPLRGIRARRDGSFRAERHLLAIVIALVVLHALAPVASAQVERVRIDVKTKLLEKFGLTSAKNGAVLLLDESDWAVTTELGEDYALWIRNAQRTETSDSIALSLDVELRTPATFGEGDLLAMRHVTVVYPRSASWRSVASQSTAQLFDDVERYAGYGLTAVKIFTTPLTSFAMTKVLDAIEGELPGGSLDGAKLEAMIAGARIAYEARSMVEEARGVPAATPSEIESPAPGPGR